MTCYWDSAMVLNTRLIAADMTGRNLGNQEGLTKSAMWYLLYYEVEHGWINWKESPTKSMIDEMIWVLKMLSEEPLNTAYLDAEKTLGHTPSFNRNMIK